MQRPVIIALAVLVVAGIAVGFFVLGTNGTVPSVENQVPTPVPATAIAATALPVVRPGAPVVVDARVVPVRSVRLGFTTNAVPIAEVLVKEGDVVTQGMPLARLDTRSLELGVEGAQALLARAQAEYDRVTEGVAPAEIAEAQAAIAQAQARLRQAEAQITPEDIAAAHARIEEAQARLSDLKAGPQPADLAAAHAAIDVARASLERQRADLAATKEKARLILDERANDIRAAQIIYSAAYWKRQQLGEDADAGDPSVAQAINDLDKAQLTLSTAESVLERAQVDYEAARQDEIAGLAEAQARVVSAQANLDKLMAEARPGALAAAEADIANAVAELARLYSDARQGEIDAAAAGVSLAEARLEGLTAGPRASEIARATAAISQSQVDLKRAELALQQATLTASINGTVAALNVEPGELPRSSQDTVVLADFSSWLLEAGNLSDLNVVQVQDGAPVTMTFYALPDLKISGRVARVKPNLQNEEGRTTYTVLITPDQWDARLRWNMLAQATIETKP